MDLIKKIQFKFDERGLMMINQAGIFIVSFISLVYGLLVYFNFLACNCINIQIFNLEQKIEQYGLAVVGELIFDLITIPLVLYNLSRLYNYKEFNPFFEFAFEASLFMRVMSGALVYYFNLQEDELAYFSYFTFKDYCQSFLNITQDQCTVLEYINSYSNSNLTLVCVTSINLLFFMLFYHINYKKPQEPSDQVFLELSEDKRQ